jgi:formate dehydrogenase subunit delta
MAVATQVRLANDIAGQFGHLSHEEAVSGIATHVRMFWDPRMRSQLLAAVDAGDGGLSPLVVEAVARLR